MTRLSFIVIAFFLVLAACTAKLQQHSNNNTSINTTTVDKGLQGGAAKRDSIKTIEEKSNHPIYDSFYKSYTYQYLPTDSKNLQAITEKVEVTDTLVYAGRRRYLKENVVCMDLKDFISAYSVDLGLTEYDSIAKSGEQSWYQYSQYHKGILVEGSGVNGILKNNCLTQINGYFTPNLSIDAKPSISAEEALQKYLDDYAMPFDTSVIKRGLSIVRDMNNPQQILRITGKNGLDMFRVFNAKYIKSIDRDTTLGISYKFILPVHDIPYWVDISAHTGKVKKMRIAEVHAFQEPMACQNGTVHTEYGGYGGNTPLAPKTYDNLIIEEMVPTIQTIYDNGNYLLEADNSCYQGGILLRSFSEWLPPVASSSTIVNSTNNWLNADSFNQYATIYWGIQKTYDYYQTEHNLIGWYDNNHEPHIQKPIRIGVNYGSSNPFLGWAPNTNYPNAVDGLPLIRVSSPSNNPTDINDDIGNLITSQCSWGNLGSIDLLGHEYTHAIDHYNGLNLYSWQPDGSDPNYLEKVFRTRRFLESVCDIMGACVEYKTIGTYDWVFMHDLTNSKELQRSFAEPNVYSYHIAEDCAFEAKTYQLGQPRYYNQPGFYDNGTCEDDSYVNGGVLNHWFYLLVKGSILGNDIIDGIHYTVNPINADPNVALENAENIIYMVFLNNLTDPSIKFDPNVDDYEQICMKTLLAANTLFPPIDGICSPELRSVKEAWKAVNLNCPLPSGVTCSICLPESPDNNICDNHLPYLTHLKATQGITVAEQQWLSDGISICLTEAEDMSNNFAIFDQDHADVTLTINASEPLATLNLDGLWLGSVYYSLDTESTIVASTPTPNIDHTEWTITLQHNPESPYAVVSNLFVVANTLGENAYHLHFTGTDMADNPLEAMKNYANYNTTNGCLPLSNLPTRNPDGTWTDHYAGTDATFWLNIDQCSDFSPQIIAHTPPSAPIGTLNIVSTTNPITSYSVIDNETGDYTVIDQVVQHPATIDGYYDPSFGFTTFGTLPNNYTIILNYGTCFKALTGTTSTNDCQIPTTQSLITDYHTAEDSAHPEYTTLFLTLNTTDLQLPISISVAGGSVGTIFNDLTSNNFNASLLTNEILTHSFAISITDANGCVYTEVITPSFPVGIDDCQNTGLAFTGSYNSITVCNGEQICLPYSVQDYAGIDDVTPAFGTLNNLNNYTQTITGSTDYMGYQVQYGTICFDVAEQSIGEHTVTLMATTISQNPCSTYDMQNYTVIVECCPTTFTPTTITPAYIGCNGNIVQGGTATITSNATCLQDYHIINGIDHTAYNLTPGQNTLNIAANQSNYPTIVDIPSITLTNNNLTATATQTTTSQGCNDYCTATLTIDARLQIDDNNYNTNNTYTWSDCPTCNTPNRTNICAGNYTVTITNTTSGCTKTFTYTIQPSTQTTYNTPFEELMCCVQNTNLAISATSQNITYPDPLQPTRPAYLVSGNQTWTPTNNPFVGITVTSGDALYLGADIVVEAGSQLNLNDLSMYFATHCRLLVQAGGHLSIGQSTLDGFCNAMWQGIQVEGLGWQQTNNGIGTLELTETTINNAVIGVAAMNLALINFDNLISLPAAASNNYASMSSLYLPYLWSIDARNTAGGQVSTNNCTFNNCFQGVNISWLGNDNNTISETHFNSTALRLPFNNLTDRSEAGINALWVDGIGSINNCTFDNQRYGIRLNEVKKFGSNGNIFTNNLCGISSRAWLMDIAHGTYLNNNTFDNCRLAIQADGIDNLQAHQNLINTTNSSNSQLNYATGSAGIYARGCNSLLQNNQINKVRFGIILSDSDEDGSQIAGNIINQTQEAIVCEGLNNSCYFTCNHLLDFTKFGLDVRAAGITTGKLPPQGDCTLNEPAANTFVPLDAIDIVMGANTTDLYYDDVAADMLLVAYAPGTLTGGFTPETNGCNGTNLVDYCQDLRLTSIADIDQLPDGIKRDKELTKWFLTYLRDNDYESAMTIVHKYNNNIMLRKLVPHKIDKDSVLVAESLLQNLVLNSQENTKFKELYTLLIDLQKDNRTLFDITPTELATLTDIANSKTKTAYKAQTLLYAYNGTEYPVTLPYLANGDPQNHWITVFKGNQAGRISTLYPNPTTNTTYLNYQLADKQTATLQLYDLTGRQLQTHNLSGTGTYNLSLGNYPSGIYFCTILVDDVVIKTEKIVLSR